MNLDMASQLFTNSVAFFGLTKLKILSLSPYVVALKVAFFVEVDFWKLLPFGLIQPYNFGSPPFTIGFYLITTW